MRKKAIERDRKCLKCKATSPLSVHHIYPKSLYPEKTFDLGNLRTLCCNCHAKLHLEIPLARMSPGSGYFDKWLKSG